MLSVTVVVLAKKMVDANANNIAALRTLNVKAKSVFARVQIECISTIVYLLLLTKNVSDKYVRFQLNYFL